MNPELIYPLICILLCAACVLAYHWGKDRGVIAERIRLTGSSLPRYENPPPPPPKYVFGGVNKEVTQDQLIDALMDMRLENFLCAHTIPAHAGTDLYYFSRKETAECLLDMYHITPKAKH